MGCSTTCNYNHQIRPLVDLKQQEGVSQMASIANAVSDLVLEFGGSMSGEHGDGRARSIWNEKMFGSQIYDAFRQVKRTFDPAGIMNPGNIVDSPPMTEHLKIGPSYRPLEVTTGFRFAQEGSFAHAIEMCNGRARAEAERRGPVLTWSRPRTSTRDGAPLPVGKVGALPVDVSHRSCPSSMCLECRDARPQCPRTWTWEALEFSLSLPGTGQMATRSATACSPMSVNWARLGSFSPRSRNWSRN